MCSRSRYTRSKFRRSTSSNWRFLHVCESDVGLWQSNVFTQRPGTPKLSQRSSTGLLGDFYIDSCIVCYGQIWLVRSLFLACESPHVSWWISFIAWCPHFIADYSAGGSLFHLVGSDPCFCLSTSHCLFPIWSAVIPYVQSDQHCGTEAKNLGLERLVWAHRWLWP